MTENEFIKHLKGFQPLSDDSFNCLKERFKKLEKDIKNLEENIRKESEIMKALEDQKGVFLANGVFVFDSLDLINRKNAECKECGIRTSECIEKLQKQIAEKDAEIKRFEKFTIETATENACLHTQIKYARVEAIKEFLKKVKCSSKKTSSVCSGALVTIKYTITKKSLDQIAKEMGVEL